MGPFLAGFVDELVKTAGLGGGLAGAMLGAGVLGVAGGFGGKALAERAIAKRERERGVLRKILRDPMIGGVSDALEAFGDTARTTANGAGAGAVTGGAAGGMIGHKLTKHHDDKRK